MKSKTKNYVLNETLCPFTVSVKLKFSTVVFVDDDIGRRFCRSDEWLLLLLLVKWIGGGGGDDNVLARSLGSKFGSLEFLIAGFEHWNISFNSRRNKDDVAE